MNILHPAERGIRAATTESLKHGPFQLSPEVLRDTMLRMQSDGKLGPESHSIVSAIDRVAFGDIPKRQDDSLPQPALKPDIAPDISRGIKKD